MAPLKAIGGCWKCQTKVDVVRGEGKITFIETSYWKNLLYVTITENTVQMAADCSPLGSSLCSTQSQTKCCWFGSCIHLVSPLCKAHAVSSGEAMPLTLKILHKQASGNLSMGTLQSSLPHCINAQSETIRILLKAHHFNKKNYYYYFFWF